MDESQKSAGLLLKLYSWVDTLSLEAQKPNNLHSFLQLWNAGKGTVLKSYSTMS